VQLAFAGPADEVAAAGGGGQPALDGQPGLGRVELGACAVDDDGELPDRLGEAGVEPPARVLELREDALDVGGVALVVARDERLRGGL